MDKTFHIDGDFLQEDAPPKPVGHGFPTNESYAKLKQDNYDYALKLKTLARYPLARGMEWQKTTGIKETEFEVGMCNCAIGQNCPFVAEKWFTTCKVAVPLYMPVAEERTLLDSIKEVMGCTCPEIYKSRGMAAPNCAECNYAEDIAAHLLKRFNITNK